MNMKTHFYAFLFVVALLLAACGAGGQTVAPEAENPALDSQQAAELTVEAYPGAQFVLPVEPDAVEAYPAPEEAGVPVPADNCASAEANELGAAIAADYAFTTLEQVMDWFCAGAEFEDILVALETADQTGESAEEMLTMLAAGLSWEEIWQVVGLTGQP